MKSRVPSRKGGDSFPIRYRLVGASVVSSGHLAESFGEGKVLTHGR